MAGVHERAGQRASARGHSGCRSGDRNAAGAARRSPAARAHALSGPLRGLAQLLQQALVLSREQTFIGLGNYAFRVRRSGVLGSVCWRGTVYAVATIVLQLVLGVAAALLLNEAFPGRNILRAIVIFPYMIPTIVAVILWKWLLNSQFGLVNYLLEAVGPRRDQPISLMGKDWIMASLIVMSVWQFFPFVVVAVLARLQTIPAELYEAAKVDGATAWRRFRFMSRCPSSRACCS